MQQHFALELVRKVENPPVNHQMPAVLFGFVQQCEVVQLAHCPEDGEAVGQRVVVLLRGDK